MIEEELEFYKQFMDSLFDATESMQDMQFFIADLFFTLAQTRYGRVQEMIKGAAPYSRSKLIILKNFDKLCKEGALS